MILLDTGVKAAMIFAQRLRQEISLLLVRHEDSEISFTISLGVAELATSLSSPEQWLKCADDALYSSKQNGRNQVTRASCL